MAEVLGTAVGVLSLALQVAGGLHDIASGMRGAPSEVKDFAAQIEELTGIMSSVYQILESQQHLFKPQLFKQVHSAFQRFEDLIREIKKLIPAGTTKRTSWKPFLWAFSNRKKVRESMGQSIEAIKSSMQLVLNMASLATSSSSHGVISDLALKLDILGADVKRCHKVVQRLEHGSGNGNTPGKRDTVAARNLRMQHQANVREDAATWLYRLVFLPATQPSESIPDRAGEGSGGSSTNDTPTIDPRSSTHRQEQISK